MNMLQILTHVNFVAVFVAALGAFLVGWFWYGPLFGKMWMKLNGFTEAGMKERGRPMSVIMGLNFLSTFFAGVVLALFLDENSGPLFGMFAGFMIAVFWIGASRLNDVLYERKPFKLFLINVGYNLAVYLVMGAVIGVWH